MHTFNPHSLPEKYHITVTAEDEALRLDRALSHCITGLSREAARKYIQIGGVWVNGKRTQIQSRKVKPGDEIVLHISRAGCRTYYEINPRQILYKDSALLFYRKEPGIPTQPVPSDSYNNLYAALMRYLKAEDETPYLGLHHRLDMDTSGVILFTRSTAINKNIHEQFRNQLVKKSYLALVAGTAAFNAETVTTYISRQNGKYVCASGGPGKIAVTRFTTLEQDRDISLIRAEPQTGRTHQIRLQLTFLGHSILGDALYGAGPTEECGRTMLHAESLSIIHPALQKELCITADLFEDMQRVIMKYSGHGSGTAKQTAANIVNEHEAKD
jgi:23S rRNA pseudouridine1911/1915/1917 synthase